MCVELQPRMLSFEQAAGCIGDLVHAYTALHYQGRVCAGDTVLIMDGATAFGFIAVQLARQWGAKVCIALPYIYAHIILGSPEYLLLSRSYCEGCLFVILLS